jgi:hypothetical protein
MSDYLSHFISCSRSGSGNGKMKPLDERSTKAKTTRNQSPERHFLEVLEIDGLDVQI